MIDKITLRTYDLTSYKITNPFAFSRDTRLPIMGKNWHKNNTAHRLPVYHPQVFIHRFPDPKRPSQTLVALEISGSLPKILFQNNLYELTDADFDLLCATCSQRLDEMGIQISPVKIATMSVCNVEFSKNILCGCVPVSYILEELYRAKPLNHFMDVQRTAYRNGGAALVFYCEGYEIIFYDKYLEMQRALAQDPQILPAALRYKLQRGQANILRMEVRFHNRAALKACLSQNALPDGSLFKDVFSRDISKQILNTYWKKLSQYPRGLSPFVMSPAFELWKLNQGRHARNPIQKKLACLGVRLLLREHGYKGAQQALKTTGDTNPAQTLRKYVSKTFRPHKKLNMWAFMDGALNRFCCLDKHRWQNWRTQTRGPWYYATDPLLDLGAVAKWLNVGINEVRKLIQDKLLRAKQIHRCWRVHRYDVLDYLYTA